jgi:hypothetical protein
MGRRQSRPVAAESPSGSRRHAERGAAGVVDLEGVSGKIVDERSLA